MAISKEDLRQMAAAFGGDEKSPQFRPSKTNPALQRKIDRLSAQIRRMEQQNPAQARERDPRTARDLFEELKKNFGTKIT